MVMEGNMTAANGLCDKCTTVLAMYFNILCLIQELSSEPVNRNDTLPHRGSTLTVPHFEFSCSMVRQSR